MTAATAIFRPATFRRLPSQLRNFKESSFRASLSVQDFSANPRLCGLLVPQFLRMVIEPDKPTMGLRFIAIFEAVKGALGLAIGIELYRFAGNHMDPVIEWVVHYVRLSDGGHFPKFIVEMVTHPNPKRIEVCTMLAVPYAALRFGEAYGLWLARRWGEWLTLVSAALYVPIEIYALTLGVSVLMVALLLLNLVFVAYLAVILRATRRKRAIADALARPAPARCDTNVTQG